MLLRVRCDRNRQRRLRDAIKDGAQAIGLVIAYVETTARSLDNGFILDAVFQTDAPKLGAELCAYLVAGMQAEAQPAQEWDRDSPLLALQKRRRRAALPVAALQLVAEANLRDLPVLYLPDGQIQLGYGVRGWRFDPQASTQAQPAWTQIGRIPLVAVTGFSARAVTVARYAAMLTEAGLVVRSLDWAGFDRTRELLSDQTTQALVVGLDTADALRNGLAFDRCDQAVICDMDGAQPPEALDHDEWLRAIGLPMLLCDAAATINLADTRLHSLIQYAPNGVVALSI